MRGRFLWRKSKMKKLDFERLAQEARQASLLEYFQRSGYTVKRQGSEYYVTDIPGLCIKPDTNQWFHHYTGQGSTNNSVNCLVWVLGKDFRQAVYELTGQDITHTRSDEFPRSQRPQYTAPPRPAGSSGGWIARSFSARCPSPPRTPSGVPWTPRCRISAPARR